MKLENTVGLVGGISALAGCFLPLLRSSVDGTFIIAGQYGPLAMALYALAAIGILASLLGLLGKWRREEILQVIVGIAGVALTFILQRQGMAQLGEGSFAAWGARLLYGGFVMLLLEGLINFGEKPRRVAAQ